MRGDQSAFPADTAKLSGSEKGLTRRELFAAMAMQGLLASDRTFSSYAALASHAALVADDLIRELSK